MSEQTVSVLFVCTGNSCRSQMAEGLLRHLGGDRVRVMSAGSHPADAVAPCAVQVMKEIGIDISHHYPKSLQSLLGEKFDWVITLCDSAKQSCPVFPGGGGQAKRLHWSIQDPHGSSTDEETLLRNYRKARDDIEQRIRAWLEKERILE